MHWHEKQTQSHESDSQHRGPRRRGGRRPRRSPGGHRSRARRGAVAEGVLLVLADGPMHGYELIAELEQRSEGRWRPSPGAMYPALGRLESRGLIAGVGDEEGKRRYELTDEGRQRVERRDPDAPLPWTEEMGGSGGSLRSAVAELVGQAKQIGRFGTPEQQAAAAEVLADAKRRLYAVMADAPETT